MKFVTYFLQKSLVMGFIIMFTSLQGMENPCQKIGIFGAAPRYSLFRAYCVKVLQHFKVAIAIKRENANLNARRHVKETLGQPQNQSFNRVFGPKTNAKLGRSLPKLEQIESKIDNLLLQFYNHKEHECQHFETLVDMFLNCGIHQKTMLDNVQKLLNAAHDRQITKYIHVFLPTYFLNVDNLLPKAITIFSERSRKYFQCIYDLIDLPKDMHISIMIPKMNYFDDFLNNQKIYSPQDFTNHIASFFYKEVMLLTSEEYYFINQDQEQNQALCAYFNQHYNMTTHSISFKAYDYCGRDAKQKFVPYFTRANDEDYNLDYNSIVAEASKSPILSAQCLEYLESIFLR